MSRVACLIAALWLGACVTPPATQYPESPVKFPNEAVEFYRPSNLKQTILYRPARGEPPFPAVVLAHTCGGVGGHIYDWARRLTAAGYVVLIVDGLSPRNVANNCLPAWQATVSVDAYNGDIVAGLAHLRSLSFVKPDALGVAGYSFGAIASAKLTSPSYRQRFGFEVDGLKAIAFFYAPCGTSSQNLMQRATYDWPTDPAIPLIAFLGASDNESPPATCVAAAERLKAQGRPVAYKVYPDTTHSFDDPFNGTGGRQIYHGTRGPFLYRYNPEATEDAWREMKALFDRELRSAK